MVPADELVDLTQFSTPVLATSAVRLASRLRLADRVAQPFNLVISNVPGPRQPLYFAGAQLCHQFPVSIVTDGQGLNVTVVSYLDRLDFGFVVNRELVPDVWDLADMHIDEIGRLFEASPTRSAERQRPTAANAHTLERWPRMPTRWVISCVRGASRCDPKMWGWFPVRVDASPVCAAKNWQWWRVSAPSTTYD
jgi:hypothetical protein